MPARPAFAQQKFEQPTIKKPEGYEGPSWDVRTKNPDFTDTLAMVPFIAGRAIVYDEALARELESRFECTVSPKLKPLVSQPAVERVWGPDNTATHSRPGADNTQPTVAPPAGERTL